jgi:chemotaxis protein CheX
MQAINADFILPFIDSTKSTFEIMLQKKVKQKEAYTKKNYVMFGDISGCIGVAGNVCGTVSVSLPADFALDCIRTMIGEDKDAPLSEMVVHDGVGEFINMIAGGAKTTLSGTENAINFTLPTIISGRGHEMYHAQGTCNTSIIFETGDGGEFSLDVCAQVK